jgi:hypothetical protein
VKDGELGPVAPRPPEHFPFEKPLVVPETNEFVVGAGPPIEERLVQGLDRGVVGEREHHEERGNEEHVDCPASSHFRPLRPALGGGHCNCRLADRFIGVDCDVDLPLGGV